MFWFLNGNRLSAGVVKFFKTGSVELLGSSVSLCRSGRSSLSFRNQPLETIYALCSGIGKCGVAVVRVSGNEASAAIYKMAKYQKLPCPRYAHLKSIYHPVTGEILDKGLVFWYPAPNSFTGEDIAEFQVHGGPTIVSALLEAISHLPNTRMAGPGEFTKRAFYNQKMDLVEAEGLADLINAETECQRKQALKQSQGALSKIYKKWRSDITELMGNFEALFNFETSLDDDPHSNALATINCKAVAISDEIGDHLHDNHQGEILRDGFDVVIFGEPNVGKSSLFNKLCQKEAAIVTAIPGTTRDTLVRTVDINGYPVILHDTCGIRSSGEPDPIEVKGMELAEKAVDDAHLMILLADANKFVQWKMKNAEKPVGVFVRHYMAKLKLSSYIHDGDCHLRSFFKKPCIVVFNKCDELVEPIKKEELDTALAVSIAKSVRMNDLVDEIAAHAKMLCGNPLQKTLVTKARHRALLEKCSRYLESFTAMVNGAAVGEAPGDYAILGSYLRAAERSLTEIVDGGRPNQPVTDVLDEIFSNFCIGK